MHNVGIAMYYLEWRVVKYNGSKNGDQNGHMSKIDWTACSNYDNHLRLNIIHETRNFVIR